MTKPWSFPTKESICLSQFESNSNLSIPLKVAEELSSTLLNDKKIGIACSGGADSVFLTLLLFFKYPDIRENLHLLHFNHLLRAEDSDFDEKFVQDLAEYFHLPFHSGKNVHLQKKDEASLRENRLNFFQEKAVELDLSTLALGHHADDVAETILWRLPRSSTVSGLVSPKPVNRHEKILFIRPLINTSREEIRTSLKMINFPWREDKSNEKPNYLRNRIRSNVIPNWRKSMDRDLIKGISKTRELLEQDHEALIYFSRIAYNECRHGDSIDINFFNNYPIAIRRRVFRCWIQDHTYKEVNFDGRETDILDQIEMGVVTTPDICQTVRIKIERDLLSIFESAKELCHIPKVTLPLNQRLFLPDGLSTRATEVDGRYALKEISMSRIDKFKEAFIEIEGSKINIRSRIAGDRYQLLGSSGSKKISKIMTNAKWTKDSKIQTPLFVSQTNEVLWIPGFPPSENYKIRPESKRVIHLTYG